MGDKQQLRSALKWSAICAAGMAMISGAIGYVVASVHATPLEKTRPLPGDDLITEPVASLTHAITIHRSPQDVWLWLAQMGAGNRAGWYSYDRFDNGRKPSAEHILPDLQHLELGMVFPWLPGATEGFTLTAFEPARFLILDAKRPDDALLVTWAFVLQPLADGSTRLIVRARGSAGYRFRGLPCFITKHVAPVVHFVMQRKQLLGIAKRAESMTTSPTAWRFGR